MLLGSVILVLLLLFFAIYKLCVYLNKGDSIKKKKINSIIIKGSLIVSGLLIFLILFNCFKGYFYGSSYPYCFYDENCFVYGSKGLLLRLFYSLPVVVILALLLSYIIIYKKKYKKRILNEKLYKIFKMGLIISGVTFLIIVGSFGIYYKCNFIDNLVIYDSSNKYYVRILKNKMNVVVFEEQVCIQAPCIQMYDKKYSIPFSNDTLNKIQLSLKEIDQTEYGEKVIIYDEKSLKSSQSLALAIINKNEDYLK